MQRRTIELLEPRLLLHAGVGPDDLGVFRAGLWLFHDPDQAGGQSSFAFGAASDVAVVGDWDGDGDDNVGIFRQGAWHLDMDDTGHAAEALLQFGLPGDIPVAGDWDGDGDDDVAIFRGGVWHFDLDDAGGTGEAVMSFGIPGDVPVAGDWDGDGDDDLGVYRNGVWFFDLDGAGGPGERSLQFGTMQSAPVVGDWDGDGTADPAFFQDGTFTLSLPGGNQLVQFGSIGDVPVAGHFNLAPVQPTSSPFPNGRDVVVAFQGNQWSMDLDGNGGTAEKNLTFGVPGDIPVVGDWDGDGDDDTGVFRNGTWFFDLNDSGGMGEGSFQFGTGGDIPVVGDWDSDGDDDAGLFRNGIWLFDMDDAGGAWEARFAFGVPTDRPVTGDWDGDGDDDAGVFRNGTWFFDLDDNGIGGEQKLVFGSPNGKPIGGDWNGDGIDEPGVFLNGLFSLYVDGGTAQVGFGSSFAVPLAGHFLAPPPVAAPLPMAQPAIQPPGGWDPGLRTRCVRYADGEALISTDCNGDEYWLIAVHSENGPAGSVGPGPANKSFQINSDPQVSFDLLPESDGSYTAAMNLDFIQHPHPLGDGYFTWYSFMDHISNGGANHPTVADAFSHHELNYTDSVLPGTGSAVRLLAGGWVHNGTDGWLIEINLASNSWGDAHPSEKYVWNPPSSTFGFSYVTLNGPAWGYAVERGETTSLDINWGWLFEQVTKDWEAGLIQNWSPPPNGWESLTINAVNVAIEAKNRAAAQVLQSDYTLSLASSVGRWEPRAATGISRQEVAFVESGGKLYLAGGGTAHQVYDPILDSWSNVAPLPQNLDHIQGVALDGLIYYIGGLNAWPGPASGTVYVYNPATNSFSIGTPMLPGRERGAGGVAAFDGKIYYAGGLHDGTAVPWFDVYDPSTGTWTALPDMPTSRDHFHAVVADGKFFAIGGRDTLIDAATQANEAYDIASGTWNTGLAPLPTARGGFAAALVGDEILILGGEGGGRAFNTVEAYNTVTDTWRTLAPMPEGRHGIQAAVLNGAVHIAAGAEIQGLGPVDTHRVFFPDPPVLQFDKSVLSGTQLAQPTSLQFGPDGRLYVAQQNGMIKVHTVARNGPNDYVVTATETITAIHDIPNHNDDGSLNTAVTGRLLTGILVGGTATNPVIYASSSDPRIGAGPSGEDLDLDTNSGILSRLTWNGAQWDKLDLVRGLPRSEEQHAGNGLQLDPTTNTLFLAMGGNTNMGAPSNNFALLPEYALSASILSVDLGAIGESTYDLPTLDDEDRPGIDDAADPFGGNNGKNQAMLVPGGPVQVYAPGFRNPYDLVITRAGRMYSIDNGPNAGWGNVPIGEGPNGTATNQVNEPGITLPDGLHYVTGPGYYAGHPNPTRSNPNNTFNPSNPQSPVSVGNPIESDYLAPLTEDGALAVFYSSTNGLAEYAASNFAGAMDGDLLAASFDNTIYRLKTDGSGGTLLLKQALFNNVGLLPLDVTAQDDQGQFPGTIWAADYLLGSILVFEPQDGGGSTTCTGVYDAALDDDLDGYHNADEMDNGTNACSAADVPPDWDADFTSNLNDPDDDNDGLPDVSDPFVIDPNNGLAATLPVHFTWENDASNPGGLLNLGFTGLMTNGITNYEELFDPANMTAGGAAGVLTVDAVPAGDALGQLNTQEYAFQFGVPVDPTGSPIFAHTRVLAPFAGLVPEAGQSMGLFIGTGDQDNYAKLVISAGESGTAIELVKEVNGVVSVGENTPVVLPGADAIDLYLTVDPATGMVQPSYSITSGGVTGVRTDIGFGEMVPTTWVDGTNALAVGIIATSAGAAPLPVTWDFIEVDFDPVVPNDPLLTELALDQVG